MEHVLVDLPAAHGTHLHVLARDLQGEGRAAGNGAGGRPDQKGRKVADVLLLGDPPVGLPQGVIGKVIGGGIGYHSDDARGEPSVQLPRAFFSHNFDECVQKIVIDVSLQQKPHNIVLRAYISYINLADGRVRSCSKESTSMVSRVLSSSRGYVHIVEHTPAMAPATSEGGRGILGCSPGSGVRNFLPVSKANSCKGGFLANTVSLGRAENISPTRAAIAARGMKTRGR